MRICDHIYRYGDEYKVGARDSTPRIMALCVIKLNSHGRQIKKKKLTNDKN